MPTLSNAAGVRICRVQDLTVLTFSQHMKSGKTIGRLPTIKSKLETSSSYDRLNRSNTADDLNGWASGSSLRSRRKGKVKRKKKKKMQDAEAMGMAEFGG